MSKLSGGYRSILIASVLVVGVPLVVPGCAGGAGVTPGGQEDIAAARLEIQSGGIPDPDAITIEGFMSEHAIPIEEPPDAPRVYATAGVAWNADFDTFAPVATVQIGFGSTIDREAFRRAPLNLTVLIDRSGSMGDPIDYRTSTSKLDAVKIAVDRLVAQLDANDRLSLVTFDFQPHVLLDHAVGNDLARIKPVMEAIVAEGGTELAKGLRQGFAVTARNSEEAREDRVLVFTDAQLLYRAAEDVQLFLSTMREYADRNIGATIFGLGFDFGHEVAFDIAQVRGANYFFLSNYERIVSVFDDEFDFLVTPVAYDVELTIDVPLGFDIEDVYGIGAEEPFTRQLELKVPTLFLSSREGGGAIFVRARPGASLDRSLENPVATINLSYETPEGEPVAMAELAPVLPPEGDSEDFYFESAAVRRGVLLMNTAKVLHDACADIYVDEYYWYYDQNALERAVARLTDFLDYFDQVAEGLEDCLTEDSRCLSQEKELVEKLRDNIEGLYYY